LAVAFPLQALLDHSRHRLEAAERLLRMLKRKEELAQQRLQELQGYKSEYQARLSGGGATGMNITLLRDFYAFLIKLDSAISHQSSDLAQAHVNWQAAHDQWLALRQKVKAFETLATRHAHQEMQKEERRDQRLTDETALRKHADRKEETH
jgi:flagellar FliJ protein